MSIIFNKPLILFNNIHQYHSRSGDSQDYTEKLQILTSLSKLEKDNAVATKPKTAKPKPSKAIDHRILGLKQTNENAMKRPCEFQKLFPAVFPQFINFFVIFLFFFLCLIDRFIQS